MNIYKQAACFVLVSASCAATAAPVTFDFTIDRAYSTETQEYIGSDGVSSVDVTAYAEYGVPYLASSEESGLYIYTCTNRLFGCGADNHQIDGWGPNEAAVLDFGTMVDLVSVTFNNVGYNDDFTLFSGPVDGSGNLILDDAGLNGGFWEIFDYGLATYTFSSAVSGSEFAFLADHWSDDFTLYSITADYVSNVPEPASLSLLGLGLMALGSMRRKVK